MRAILLLPKDTNTSNEPVERIFYDCMEASPVNKNKQTNKTYNL